MNGIGCKQNKKLAQEYLQKEEQESLWSNILKLEAYIKKLCHEPDTTKVLTGIKNLFESYAQQRRKTEYAPDLPFMYETLYHWIEKQNYTEETLPMAALQVFLHVVLLADRYGREKFCLYIAKIFTKYPGLHSSIVDLCGTSMHVKKPYEYLEKAVDANVAGARAYKAKCILHRQLGYDRGDRLANLKIALNLLINPNAKLEVEDRINRRLVENEIASLTQKKAPVQQPQEIDISDDEDSGEEEQAEVVSQPAPVIPTSTSSCSSTDPYPHPLSRSQEIMIEHQRECDDLIEEARKKSKAKKKGWDVQHKIILPENYTGEEKTAEPKVKKINAEAYAFLQMIYGYGDRRIHHYQLKDIKAPFKALGLVSIDQSDFDFSYLGLDGKLHKLSFHPPHGHKENALYDDIRKIIRRFFMSEKITLDYFEVGK